MRFKIKPTAERFYNSNSNWGVYVFQTKEEVPHCEKTYDFDPFDTNPYDDANVVRVGTLCGNMQRLTIGVTYEVVAEAEFNQKYKSWQYQPSMITSVVPKTHDEQVAYLKTQVTELQAKNILEVYPNVVDDVMNGKDIDYSTIHGVGEYTWNKIKKNIFDNYAMSDLLVYLQPLGITFKMLSKLLGDEPNPVLLQQKIKEDPYVLTKIKGLGFKTVDAMALKLNSDINYEMFRVSRNRTRHKETSTLGRNVAHTLNPVSNLQNFAGILDYTITFYELINIDEAELAPLTLPLSK
jgi:exodeoxyribonuclease V alpha subunit